LTACIVAIRKKLQNIQQKTYLACTLGLDGKNHTVLHRLDAASLGVGDTTVLERVLVGQVVGVGRHLEAAALTLHKEGILHMCVKCR
jgi:hypothetical protein